MKFEKLFKKIKQNRQSTYFLILGILIFTFGAVNFFRVRALSFSKVPAGALEATRQSDTPTEIIIPSIGVDLNVDPAQIKDGVWQISQNNATFLDSSATPGSGGNTVIYGHNKKIIFGNLPYLSLGQKIMVKTKSGKIFKYVADKKYFVGSERVDLVSPTSSEVLTIYTCWGPFDSQRAVIVAKPIST